MIFITGISFSQVYFSEDKDIYIKDNENFLLVGKLKVNSNLIVKYNTQIIKDYQSIDIIVDNDKEITTYKGYYIKVNEKEKENVSRLIMLEYTGPGTRPSTIVQNPITNPTWMEPYTVFLDVGNNMNLKNETVQKIKEIEINEDFYKEYMKNNDFDVGR